MPFYQQNMDVSCDGGDERLMFIWPTIVVHKITKDSPLYNLSAQDMLRERFEIVVMLGMLCGLGFFRRHNFKYVFFCRGCGGINWNDNPG